MGLKHTRIIAGLCLATLATSAFAQTESTNRVSSNTDWSVFMEENPRECWSVSAPKETVNTRGGRVVAVSRGDILLMVSYQPEAKVRAQLTFTGGYPFAEGSSVTLNVGDSTFELFVKNVIDPKTKEKVGWAWPASVSDDAKVVTALKRGSEATLTARSSRGTQTKDTFSLLGFTAAIEDAEKRCGG
jgi:invasion associated locus B (IalB) protein